MKSFITHILVLIGLLFSFAPAHASHIVGGEMSYVFLGDSVSGSNTFCKYQVSLSIYEDCLNGSPEAIAQDNPAFLGVFDAVTGEEYELDTNIFFASAVTVPVNFTSSCASNTPATCLIKKTFVKNYAFRSGPHGYVVAYQRCCRNASIVNILDPGNDGCTYYCTIPSATISNTSAVFKNYPPQIVCLNTPLLYDNSATDADGDSLSYGFCAALDGAVGVNAKPLPVPPPYDSVAYIAPLYSSQVPMTGAPAIQINPITGLITGTPNLIGRYLVTVYCNEWRAGVLINTVKREFQFVVTDCTLNDFRISGANDTTILAGDSIQFNASGGLSYYWTPATYLSNPDIGDPVGHFPVAGTFTYLLHAVVDSACDGLDTIIIHVLDYSDFIVPTAFTPNGDHLNDILAPIPILGSRLISFKIFDRKGKLIYNGGPNDPGWDGTYKGIKQDIGTYFWELLYHDNSGATRHEKGDVTLIR